MVGSSAGDGSRHEGGTRGGSDPTSGTGSSSTGRWSRPPQDLSTERLLRNCPKVDFDGGTRPTVGRYALLSKLGQGGVGVVYHGVHAKLGTEAAIKFLPLAFHAHQRSLVERFEREARLAAHLKSEHLVGVLDVDEDPATGCHFIVMEYIHGLPADVWSRGHAAAPCVPEAQTLDVTIAATKGLVAAHLAGVVHRDVKPANIMIPFDAADAPLLERAKLADLGLARQETGEESLTGTAVAMGTPGYMSPEQATDAKRARKPADVFSMGATLYSLLTGKAPFAGSSPGDAIVRTAQGRYRSLREVRPDVSAATQLLIETCLAPDPEARFPDASALLDALLVARGSLTSDEQAPTMILHAIRRLVTKTEQGIPVVTPLPNDEGEEFTTPPTETSRIGQSPSVTAAPPADPQDRTTGADYAGPTTRPVTPLPVASRTGGASSPSTTAPSPAASVPASSPSGTASASPETSVSMVPPWAPHAEPQRRNRTAAAVGILVVLLVAAVAALVFFSQERNGDGPDRTRSGTAGLGSGPRNGTSRGVVAPPEGPHTGTSSPAVPPIPPVSAEPPGLFITSEPPVATVMIDGRSYGRTPVLADDLTTGAHDVVVSLPYYRKFETQEARAERGRRTTLPVTLERAVGRFMLRGGAAQAAVRLVREGPPPKTYDFTLDGEGSLAATELEAGTYRLAVTRDGFEPHRSTIEVTEGGNSSVAAPMIEHTALLTIRAAPPGAEILLDGAVAGRTPVAEPGLPIRPGRHVVLVRLAEHADWGPLELEFVVGKTTELGDVVLRPWPVLDLGAIGEGVSAWIDGTERSGRLTLAPGRVKVELRREGYAPQRREVELVPGDDLKLEPEPWARYQAHLDFGEFPADATARIDGKPCKGVVTFARDGEVVVEVERPGFKRPAPVTVALVLGETVSFPEVAWESDASPGDLRRLLTDLRAWDAATSEMRKLAAEDVAQREKAFRFLGLETVTCGVKSREMAFFAHDRTGLEFALLPAGVFDMGSAAEEQGRDADERRRTTTLTRPFLVARTECTQAAWDKVGGTDARRRRGAKLPIENVTWADADAWCRKAGLALPTEAQWEYACRAGTQTRWCFGEDESRIGDFAWSSANAVEDTNPVGTKKPNAFGLFDVHGNVWEWCSDWYGDYSTADPQDPSGARGGTAHVGRGGGTADPPRRMRSAKRGWNELAGRSSTLGLRPVRPLSAK